MGRLTLGLGVGGRADDFHAVGADVRTRGRRLDEQMGIMRHVWLGRRLGPDVGPVGPAPSRPGGPEVLFGAFVPAALARIPRWGYGFLCAAPVALAAQQAAQVEELWAAAERPGRPRLVCQVNVALGPEGTVADARTAISAYYGFTGDPARVVDGMATDERSIRDAISAFEDIGADEVILYCHGPDPDQVDRLADLVG